MLTILTRALSPEKEIQEKGIDIRKKEIKFFLFIDMMSVYLENPNKSIIKTSRTINNK